MLFARVECADGDGGLFLYGPVFVAIVYMFGSADERLYRAVVGLYVLDVDGLAPDSVLLVVDAEAGGFGCVE